MTFTEPEISIVTVLYGGVETLRATLPTWELSLNGLPFEVVIIDNSPEDDAEVLVGEVFSNTAIQYLRYASNIGFAAGANRGARLASADSVLFLNPDVKLTRSAALTILGYKKTECGALALQTGNKVYAGIAMKWYGFLYDRPAGSNRPCIGPSGGGALFRKKLFLDFGGFPVDFFAWGEDAALALQLQAAEVSITLLPIELEHSGGHSVASPKGQAVKARLLVRNRIWTFRRYFSKGRRLLSGPFFIAAVVLNGFFRKSLQGTFPAYVRGIAEGFGE